MLNRRVENQINNWINNGEKALLIDGARQVGKTFTIRHCLQNAGVSYIEINLIENQDAVRAFSVSESVEDLVVNLSAVTGKEFVANETILFIDEVQESKEIVTRVKFWVDDGRYRFIMSGSLLGVELRALRSAPVGYVHEIKMYPLDFDEFMDASGVTEIVKERIYSCFSEKKPVGETIHNKMMKLFFRYLVVGGMPMAVNEYIKNGNITSVTEIQKDILNYYKRDFSKYESWDSRLFITNIYETIPSELLKQNRRFNYADIKKGLRFERVENTFIWLYKAGVVLHAFNTTEPKVTLKLNQKSNLVKLYYSDVGLLTCACNESIRKDILFGDRLSNLGGIYENAIIQELTAHGFEVYYYNSKKLGELDFVIEYNGSVLPIEVKSGKDYYVHSAINNVLTKSDFGIQNAVVFTTYDVSTDKNIVYYPIYMAGFLKNEMGFPRLSPIDF